MKLYILLGPPGSGKGTQAELIKKNWQDRELKFKFLSLGEEIRNCLNNNKNSIKDVLQSKMNKGELLPSIVPLGIIFKELIDCDEECENVLIDGFGRKRIEGQIGSDFFECFGGIDIHVIVLSISDEEIKKRLELRQREDDGNKSIENRITYWKEETMLSVEEFKKNSKIKSHEVDGAGTVEEVFERIKNIV